MEARTIPFVVVPLVTIIVLGADVLPATGPGAPHPARDPAPALAGVDESAGERIWLRDCAVCHRPDGSGSERGPSLDGVGAAGVDFAVRTGRMPIDDPSDRAARGPVEYGPGEIRALVEYAATVVDGPGVPGVDLAGADLARGGQVYRTHCASCHQMAGQGGVLTDGRNIPRLEAATPTETVEAIRSGPNNMPVFPESLIDDASAVDVAAYVDEIRDPHDRGGWALGRWGPVPEGAAALVLGLIPLVLLARWLGDRRDRAAEVVIDEAEDDHNG